jgi:flagellar biosynthetic protein FliR
MALALALGTHRVVISYLLESFRELPVGASLRLTASAPIFVELAGSAIAVGTRLAMPVIATAVALQVVLAMLARAAPSMQLFSVGFSVLILAGFATAIASLPGIGVGLASHFGEINTALDRLFVEIAPVR